MTMYSDRITYTGSDYLELLIRNKLVIEYDLRDSAGQDIKNLTCNSKEVSEDTMFVCKGVSFREEYLAQAAAGGAVLYVSEVKYENIGMAYIIVSDIRKAMPYLASKFFNDPYKKIKSAAITGTKGKSTTAYYVKAIVDDYLASLNKKESAIISSIDVYDGVVFKESHITTPESIELYGHFANAVNAGIEYIEMEASSQALKYNRLDGMKFDVGVYLNISEDHISPIEHGDFDDYFNSKLNIFKYVGVSCINLDGDHIDRVMRAASEAAELTGGKIITFGTKAGGDIYGYDIRKEGGEIHFKVKCGIFDEEFVLTMPGLFNVENALAAISVAYVYGIPVKYIYSGLRRARSSGRMELYYSNDRKVTALVDYAHNKLSFEKLFESTLREYDGYRIISIFGCPGKKALLRRRDLGTVAGMYSDKVYIVAEDPGEEPVEDISRDIAQYVEAQNCPYEIMEDRGEAIEKAILGTTEKTVFLITGKGNETRQKYGKEYVDCLSDVEYTKKSIEKYNRKTCRKLGILGGLGPAASAYFYRKIVEHTEAENDREHIDMIIINHASMPDRTQALVSNDVGEVVRMIINDITALENAGAGVIAIPCNTSHAFYDAMQACVDVPVINMVSGSIKYAYDNMRAKDGGRIKKIGIMATDGTLYSKVYHRECEKLGIECVEPSADKQKDVMYIIYEEIKRGKKGSRELFDGVVDNLREKGADVIIAACTELSVYMEYGETDDICIDAMDILTKEAVERSGYSYKK